MESNKKINMTNEKLRERFSTSQFDLVSYAIKLAENMIRSGRAPRVKSDNQNIAMLILDEINQGKDHFDPLPEKEDFFPTHNEVPIGKHQRFTEMSTTPRHSEKKKPRKILAE